MSAQVEAAIAFFSNDDVKEAPQGGGTNALARPLMFDLDNVTPTTSLDPTVEHEVFAAVLTAWCLTWSSFLLPPS